MKHITRDSKHPRRAPALHTLADRRLREVRGASSVIKPEQMAQITASDDWMAPVV